MSDQESKRQILKSTGTLGVSQVFIILIGIIRVKVLAVLLGPAGVGTAGLFQALIDLIKSLTSFGLGFSSVRDIAAAAATSDERRIAIAIVVLRRLVWITGLLGTLVCLIFSRQLSNMSFGSERYSGEIAILSVTLLVIALSAGQNALLQGLRKIGDMAKVNVLGALIGLLFASFIYYLSGVEGIAFSILGTYIISFIVSWSFARKIRVQPVALNFSETFVKGKSMIRLGLFMVVSWLASTGSMFAARSFIAQNGNLDSVGFFVAAWSVGSMYISAIFDAMGADFFPRLSGVQNDNEAVGKLVNEQTEIALLLTAPIIIAVISFLTLVVQILYSKEFSATSDILSWQLVGDFFKVLSWPMGFILIAKGKGGLYILVELTWHFIFLGGTFIGWELFGLEGAGISFLIAYLVYVILVFLIVKREVSFSHNKKVKQHIKVFLPLIVIAFLVAKFVTLIWVYLIGLFIVGLAVVYSYISMKEIINLREILAKLGFKNRNN